MDGIGISGNVSLDMNVQSVVGVYKYDELRDKPKINDVEVSGSKSLDDYGIASKADVDAVASSMKIYFKRVTDAQGNSRPVLVDMTV